MAKNYINTSGLFSLSNQDAIKGAIMAALMVVVTMVYKIVQEGGFPTDWHTWEMILKAAAGVVVSYLIKNFFTNSNDQFLTKEVKPTDPTIEP